MRGSSRNGSVTVVRLASASDSPRPRGLRYAHPWDKPLFRRLGFGTAADHHVHHALFKSNFGHLFMYWDWLCGTYKDPKDVRKFNPGV